MYLKGRAFSAVRWTAAAAVARGGLQIIQLVVMARLLAPEDFALNAMVSVILSFGVVFADMGLNSAYVQRPDVSLEQRSSLFWLNLMVSGGMTVLVFASGPLFATFFGDGRLAPLLMVASATFIINGLGQQVRLSAEKALEFRAVMLVEMFAALAGFTAALAAAMVGLGAYSLVLGGLFSAAFGTALAWSWLSAGWRPLRHFSPSDVRPFLGFGAATVGDAIVNQIHRNIDIFLGGRMLVSAQLGIYSVPRDLVLRQQSMVNPIVTRVGFPLVAQVQNNPSKVRTIYLKTLSMTASVNAPVYAGLVFFAPEVVGLLFDAEWAGAIELLPILAFWGFLRSNTNPVGSLLMGLGRARLSFQWNLGLLFIIVPVLFVFSRYGAVGLAWGLFVLQLVSYIPVWRVLVFPLCGVHFLEYMDATLRPFVVALMAVAVTFFCVSYLKEPLVRLAIGVAFSVFFYLFLSYWFNRGWLMALRELIRQSRG
jgi:O-antigen/teichoic acid export membrane protein